MSVIPKHRLLSVTTPLGPEAFLLTGFSGREEISRGFRYELEMLSDCDASAARELIGQGVTWHVRPPGAEPRWFHGVVSRLVSGARGVRNLRSYRAVVVPQLCYHGQVERCRIFEGQTVPEIVESVFDGLGHSDHAWALAAEYSPRQLCIQYRESDLRFVSRLLEEEGIRSFFQHEEGRHTLTLADEELPAETDLSREVVYRSGAVLGNHVFAWERQFDGPCAADSESPSEIVNGSSNCCNFTPGDTFTLRGHDLADENGAYLLVAVEHAARDVSFTADGGGREYANTFTCLPVAVPFRPARQSARPTMRGACLARVVEARESGHNAEEADSVRVCFSADGRDRWEDNASCWVRVLSGGRAPSPEQEVVIDFLEGDPDQPLLARGGPAAGRPAADAHGNGLRFVEDAGRTEVLLEAGQDCRRLVAKDDHVTVGGDQALEVSNHRTRSVNQGNETIRIEKGHRTLTLGEGDETIRLEKGSRTLVVGGDYRQQVRKGNHELTIEAGHEVQRIQSGNRDVRVEQGDSSLQLDRGNRRVVLEAGDDVLTLKAGNHTTHIELGRSTTEAKQGIELRVGSSRIAIEPTGVIIEGLVVKVRGHAQTEIDGLMTQVSADALLEIEGGATVVG